MLNGWGGYGWGGVGYRNWGYPGRVAAPVVVGKIDPVAVLRKYGKLPAEGEECVDVVDCGDDVGCDVV